MLYDSLLGPAWPELSPPVASLHATSPGARGWFRVRRGAGLLVRVMAALMRLPPAQDRVAISLAVERGGRAERWVRMFGEQPLHTVQWGSDGLLVEGMSLFQCWFRLRAEAGALIFEQVGARVGLRGFSLPLPRFLAPRVVGRADGEGGGVRVDVSIHAPVLGMLVAYDGLVTPDPVPGGNTGAEGPASSPPGARASAG
jgi:hypothetical protein